MRPRFDFGHFIDRSFWALLTAAAVYGASQLKTVSESVEKLNIKMGVIIEKISNAEKRLDTQDRRMERIEDLIHSR